MCGVEHIYLCIEWNTYTCYLMLCIECNIFSNAVAIVFISKSSPGAMLLKEAVIVALVLIVERVLFK